MRKTSPIPLLKLEGPQNTSYEIVRQLLPDFSSDSARELSVSQPHPPPPPPLLPNTFHVFNVLQYPTLPCFQWFLSLHNYSAHNNNFV